MQTDLELYNYRPAKRDEDGCRRCRTCEHCYSYIDHLYCSHVLNKQEVEPKFVCDYYDYSRSAKIGVDNYED